MLPAFHDLVTYHDWANGRLFEAAAALPEADWTRDLGSSFASVQATLAHLIGADWVWLQRWQGASPMAPPAWATAPSVARLRVVLTDLERERADFLAPLGADDFARPVSYTLFSGAAATTSLGALVLHLVNHGTYHRGQVVALLRQLGHAPPATDLLVFLRAADGASLGRER